MMQQNLDAPGVRHALSTGDIRAVNDLLGSAYMVHALVVHGNHLGRTLGFPTANLEFPKDKPFLLAGGVYAVKVEFGQRFYAGMANAGIRPTVSGTVFSVEVNLFDFSGDLYGRTLAVYFIDRIRDERKFEGLGQLVQQLHLDRQEAVKLLS